MSHKSHIDSILSGEGLEPIVVPHGLSENDRDVDNQPADAGKGTGYGTTRVCRKWSTHDLRAGTVAYCKPKTLKRRKSAITWHKQNKRKKDVD